MKKSEVIELLTGAEDALEDVINYLMSVEDLLDDLGQQALEKAIEAHGAIIISRPLVTKDEQT